MVITHSVWSQISCSSSCAIQRRLFLYYYYLNLQLSKARKWVISRVNQIQTRHQPRETIFYMWWKSLPMVSAHFDFVARIPVIEIEINDFARLLDHLVLKFYSILESWSFFSINSVLLLKILSGITIKNQMHRFFGICMSCQICLCL